jgi:monofunctional biosynthetic peptidoglycan transglycosylase
MEYNKKKPGRIRGGSTISQQVAKNVFLWQGRSWIRKGLEVYFTFMIELLWSKDRILELYLNISEMGDGVFGIEAASRRYFKKPAAKLTRQEAAMIAATEAASEGATDEFGLPIEAATEKPKTYNKWKTIARQLRP